MIEVSSITMCEKCGKVYTDFKKVDYTFSWTGMQIHTPCDKGGECMGKVVVFDPAQLFRDSAELARLLESQDTE